VRLLSISGACSRSGKTAAAVSLLRAAGPSAVAVKFTTTEDVFERCPRGTVCVVCDIEVPFRVIEDRAVLAQAGTDTARLAEAGAARVLWAIARRSAAAEAWEVVRRRIAAAPVVIMEGSSIVSIARPQHHVFVAHPWLSPERWKPTVAACLATADTVVVNRPQSDPRPPAPEVMAALARHGARPVVADVTDPAARWAGSLAIALAAEEPLEARA
jgi:hypothetical protein